MDQRTLLFTDVVDSTKVVQRVGDAAAAALWAEHDRLSRDLLCEHCGLEIDRSDGFFLLFDSVVAAARFAMGYHAVVLGLGLAARVGIHEGPVTLRRNSPAAVDRGAKALEVEGLAKPVASRVMTLAAGGQTLLSGDAARALRPRLPSGMQLRALGIYRLKGIDEPLPLFELGDERSAFVPPADVEKAYRVVRNGDLWRPVRDVRHNLAPERDAFVGRTAELRRLAERLESGARLVSLVGAGGTGKTRLVQRYAQAWLGEWPGGVYFCDLSEARDVHGICSAVAAALEMPLGKDDPIVQLGHAIAGRGRCLVILDNFEQVVPHAGATVGRWLDRARDAAFVVTSRERLQVAGEEALPLEPLPLTDAIDLFEIRARAQQPAFELDPPQREPVQQIVRLLDGLPLAIELAAARIRVLSPAQVVQRLKDRFVLLGGAHGATGRQATLKATIDWSWDLLTSWEQAALAQCSVFEAGFTIEAAEAVLDLSAWPKAPPPMDVVQSLVDKSLLRSWRPAAARRLDNAAPYFGMYLSIHEYAVERLAEQGERAALQTRRRHGSFFACHGSDAAIDALSKSGGVAMRHALALDLGNLVAACRSAVGHCDAEIAVPCAVAAWTVLEMQGPFGPGLQLAAGVTGIAIDDARLRAAALLVHAGAADKCGDVQAARAGAEAVLAVAGPNGDRRREGRALTLLASQTRKDGRPDDALALLHRALAMQREIGDQHGELVTLGMIGWAHIDRGRTHEAKERLLEQLHLSVRYGDRSIEGQALGSLGSLCLEQGRVEESLTHLRRELEVAREVGDRLLEAHAIRAHALARHRLGDVEDAHAAYDEGLRIARELGARRQEAAFLNDLGGLHGSQGRLDEARRCFEGALAVLREIGERHAQATLLGNLAELHADLGNGDQALTLYAEALDAQRSVGDRIAEAYTAAGLGVLLGEQGRLAEAELHLRSALEIHRAVDNHRGEAMTLGDLGVVLGLQGRPTAAAEAFSIGERMLRESHLPAELALLLCERGCHDAAAGRHDAAKAALAEASSIAAAGSAQPPSRLTRWIGRLRAALASPS